MKRLFLTAALWLAFAAPTLAICGGAGNLCRSLPRGAPPQFLGYNSSDIVTAETLGGDCTLAATSDSTYGITCSGQHVYDIGLDFVGVPQASEIGAYTTPRAFTFADSFSGSVVSCGTNPSGSDSFVIADTSAGVTTTIGHLVIDTSCMGAFTTVSTGATILAGDRITITAPATVNGIADVAVTLVGAR